MKDDYLMALAFTLAYSVSVLFGLIYCINNIIKHNKRP